MSLSTHSKFYFGYEITASNYNLAFSEGGPELNAQLEVGSYSLTDFVDEIERALNEQEDATLTYTVTVNRTTRIITIAATGTFQLLVATGTTLGTTALTLIGFTGLDRTGASTYAANNASGSVYSTQFILQSHVSTDSSVGAADGVVNKSASGKVEVVTFGEERFMKANFMYITNRNPGGFVRYRAAGYDDAITFMEYLITKAPIEFMADENTPATFETMILESTAQDKNGLKFELKELYGKGLPGFFETGTLTFRKVD